jgi:vacuolar-type H+-ATPase subunit F/Vma7
MAAPVFIGDEISAAGFRLAGVRVRTPADDQILPTLEWASKQASLIMVTPEFLDKLSSEDKERFLQQLLPPVVAVPDINGNYQVEDLTTSLRAQLGVLE